MVSLHQKDTCFVVMQDLCLTKPSLSTTCVIIGKVRKREASKLKL